MTIPPNLLEKERILIDARLSTRSMVLEAIAGMFADSEISGEAIEEKLLEREELGSTGIGFGVAIPHARLKDLQSTRAAFVKTRDAVDFNAPDETSVDLIFALLVPEGSNEDYLRLLANLARFFSDAENRELLRNAGSAEEVIDVLGRSEARRQSA
ncbi:MAG: PTS sugar transporter subunit IIA [Chromatiales bacterium]|jgi:PTS system nitrogen regulatory IIA component